MRDPLRHRDDPDSSDLEVWQKLESVRGPSMMLFRPRTDTLVHPRSGEHFKRLVLETPEWVNVVALTPQREIVFVRQFRFGIEAMTLEIPGGMVDRGEEHGQAARRELREETGYSAASWTYLGSVEPNPAFQDNLCHHWLAEDARLSDPQELDSGEDIEIVLLSEGEARRRILGGEIRHALVLTALSRILDLRREP